MTERSDRRVRTAVLTTATLASALLVAAWTTQTAAAAPHPAQPARVAQGAQVAGEIPGNHGHSTAGNPSPSPGASPSGGMEHDADTHVELPQGGQAWTTPDLVAQGALVRIETVADVYVALHHYHVEKYSYTDVSDPQAVASGTFVNAQGLVATSKGALHDDEKQIERFGTYGINQAFVQAQFLKALPADPFARTTITSKNKGELADSPPTDPKINDRLQSCYEWETSHHCAVFVVMRQRVMPSVQDKDSTNLEGLPQSDARVAALSTQPRGITPLTLQLANPEPGAKYWVVSSRGLNQEPLVGTGTLTDSEREPISAEDLAKWREQFGELAEGAPVVSERGDLVAFLGTTEDSDELAAVSASHISNDLRTFGLTRDSSPVDAQFQDGLELFEASQFAAAVPKLKAAVEATGGQRVAGDLLGQSEDKAGTAEDLSDEADVLDVADDDSAGWSGLAIGVFSALVILVLIGVGIAVAMSRRRNWPTDEPDFGDESGGSPGPPGLGAPVGVFSNQGTSAGVTSSADSAASRGASSPQDVSSSRDTGLSPEGAASAQGAVSSRGTGPSARGTSFSPGASPATVNGSPNGHSARPTTLFATGTTDPKPASAQPEPGAAQPQPPAATDPQRPQVTNPVRPEPANQPRPPAADRHTAEDHGDEPVTEDLGEAPTLKRGTAQPTAPPTPSARPSGGFCRQCGAQLSPGDRFCFSCGSPSGPTMSRG